MPLTPEKRRELRSQRAMDEQWASLRDWYGNLPIEDRIGFDDFIRRMEENIANCPTMPWMEAKFRHDGHVEGS
jgi:hypothetical protein